MIAEATGAAPDVPAMFLVLSLILFAVLRLTADPLRLDDASAKPEGNAGATAQVNVRAVGNEISFGDMLTIGLDRDRQIIVKGPPNVVVDQLRRRADHFNRLPDGEKGEQILSGLIRYARTCTASCSWRESSRCWRRMRGFAG